MWKYLNDEGIDGLNYWKECNQTRKLLKEKVNERESDWKRNWLKAKDIERESD
jgi:hypothetical protein